MAYDLLLEPARINAMPMRSRVITGPMERSMANRDGSLGQVYVDYLAERARGGADLIVVESTYVDTRGMGDPFQVGCHADHVVPGLRSAADAVHAEGGKLALELNFGGRVVSSKSTQRRPLAPSSVPCELFDPMPIPRELTLAEIDEIVTRFADAARRCVEAGIDLVHLHGAHGYLLGAFLSRRTNRRTDEYGGSLENRARFALAVLAAVREVVGPDFPIGYRLSADEYTDGGLTVAETAPFSELLADAGIDLIDVSGGSYESVEMITQGPEAPKGGFVEDALRIKEAVGDRVPVSVAQRLNDPHFANEVLRRGIDFVTLSRAFHADPHYLRKLRDGEPDEIVPCIACLKCSELLAESQTAHCAVNPASGMERRRRLPRGGTRHVLVVGGGPAGMQAAQLLAGQGHAVTLCEQRHELGGQLRYSARAAVDHLTIVEHLVHRLARLEVDVRLGTAAGLDAVETARADAVILATGAGGGSLSCPVDAAVRPLDVFAALGRDDWEGELVVVVGGDSASCLAALHVARCGGTVELVEPRRDFAFDRGAAGRLSLLAALSRMTAVRLRPETTVEAVAEGWVELQHCGDHARLDGVDRVVIGGRSSVNGLEAQITRARPELELYVIGDARRPRDVYAATHEAADAVERIHLRAVG